MKRHWYLRVLKGVIVVSLGIALISWVVMSLWNWLLPALFNLPSLSWLQALGLLALSRLLFGGLRPGFARRGPWREKMRGRWAQMSPEEREKLRSGLRGRCGPWRDKSQQE